MSMYNLIEYSDNYSKTSGSLWQYYRNEPFLDDNCAIADFTADDNNSASFRFKTKKLCTKNIQIRVPLRYLGHFLENS